MTLVEQRTGVDCAVCCIAMATGRAYEEVHAAARESGGFYVKGGCADEAPILRALGLKSSGDLDDPSGDFLTRRCPEGVPPDFFRSLAWGRRAILAVRLPFPTVHGGLHAVYWDGERIFDQAPENRRESFEGLRVERMTVFRETGEHDAPRS